MGKYSCINAHIAGLSNTGGGKSRENYSHAYSGVGCCVIVVGAGAEDSFRGAAGAMFACEITAQALKEFAKTKPTEDEIAGLKERIISDWRNAVLADVRLSPFTSEETGANVYAVYTRPERAYGCTVTAALITPGYFLALQIGGGAVVAAYDDGVYVEPVPPDADAFRQSLCATDAQKSLRHFTSRVLPTAVMAVSESIQESLDQYGLFRCMHALYKTMFENGTGAAQTELEELLPVITQARDDVSLALCADLSVPPAAPKTTPQTIEEQLDKITNFAEGRQTELNALKRSKAENEVLRDALAEEIETAQKDLDEKKLKFENLEAGIASLNATVEETEFKLGNARSQQENVKQLLKRTQDFWEKRLKELGIDRG